MSKIAVIQFPGSNCERETIAAFKDSAHTVEQIRWNCSAKTFHSFDAYILPGGFSYQDRVRAGAISAKLKIIDYLIAAAQSNKAILGICNGCQILAESGLIPNINSNKRIEIALGKNTADNRRVGFICDWVYVKASTPHQNIFTQSLTDSLVIPIPP